MHHTTYTSSDLRLFAMSTSAFRSILETCGGMTAGNRRRVLSCLFICWICWNTKLWLRDRTVSLVVFCFFNYVFLCFGGCGGGTWYSCNMRSEGCKTNISIYILYFHDGVVVSSNQTWTNSFFQSFPTYNYTMIWFIQHGVGQFHLWGPRFVNFIRKPAPVPVNSITHHIQEYLQDANRLRMIWRYLQRSLDVRPTKTIWSFGKYFRKHIISFTSISYPFMVWYTTSDINQTQINRNTNRQTISVINKVIGESLISNVSKP